MCYCPTPTLHLNLALTGDCAFLLSPQKTHSVWFIRVLKNGDMGQCPHKSPSPCNTNVIPMSLYKCMSSFVTNIHTHWQIKQISKFETSFNNGFQNMLLCKNSNETICQAQQIEMGKSFYQPVTPVLQVGLNLKPQALTIRFFSTLVTPCYW